MCPLLRRWAFHCLEPATSTDILLCQATLISHNTHTTLPVSDMQTALTHIINTHTVQRTPPHSHRTHLESLNDK